MEGEILLYLVNQVPFFLFFLGVSILIERSNDAWMIDNFFLLFFLFIFQKWLFLRIWDKQGDHFSCNLIVCVKRWVPAVKEQWLMLTTAAEPYVQLATTRALEFYESSKTTLAPHVVKVQEIANPYFQVSSITLCLMLSVMLVIF